MIPFHFRARRWHFWDCSPSPRPPSYLPRISTFSNSYTTPRSRSIITYSREVASGVFYGGGDLVSKIDLSLLFFSSNPVQTSKVTTQPSPQYFPQWCHVPQSLNNQQDGEMPRCDNSELQPTEGSMRSHLSRKKSKQSVMPTVNLFPNLFGRKDDIFE